MNCRLPAGAAPETEITRVEPAQLLLLEFWYYVENTEPYLENHVSKH